MYNIYTKFLQSNLTKFLNYLHLHFGVGKFMKYIMLC